MSQVASARYLAQLVSLDTTASEKPERDKSNAALIELMAAHFAACNFVPLSYEVAPGKFNLLALSPALLLEDKDNQASSLGLLLSGHSDCVPFEAEKWSNHPLELQECEGKLYGRGACDMKGFLACMMELSAYIHALGQYPRVSFLITCDEESSMQGAIDVPNLFAKELNQDNFAKLKVYGSQAVPQNLLMDRGFELIIIGEPTLMQLVVAHKGYMARELTFKGVSAHSSNPDLGINSIYSSSTALTILQALASRLRKDFTDANFAVPYPTLNIGYITGGHSLNSICDEVKVGFDMRPTPNMDPQLCEQLIQESYASIKQECLALHGPKLHSCALKAKLLASSLSRDALSELLCSISLPFADIPAFVNDNEHSLSLLKAHLEPQVKLEHVSYCTEAAFLQKLGPTVVLGPGSIDQAHGIDEYIALEQLERCQDLLHSLIKEFEPKA